MGINLFASIIPPFLAVMEAVPTEGGWHGLPAAWQQPQQETLLRWGQTKVSSWKDQEGPDVCDGNGQGPRIEMEN